MRDEVRRPAGLASPASHSGGDGAPPGPIMRPCQELADDHLACLNACPSVDFGPVQGRRGTDGESGARPFA